MSDVVERIDCALDDALSRMFGTPGQQFLDEHQAKQIKTIREAVLSALRPGDVLPGGLVVVPIEPTERMLQAKYDAWTASDDNTDISGAEWSAMLAAAKEPDDAK